MGTRGKNRKEGERGEGERGALERRESGMKKEREVEKRGGIKVGDDSGDGRESSH